MNMKRKRDRVRAMAIALTVAMAAQNTMPALAEALQRESSARQISVSKRATSSIAAHKGATASNANRASSSIAQRPVVKASVSVATRAAKNILPNGSFEQTVSGNEDGIWENNTMPSGWKTWVATAGNKNMRFAIETDEAEAQEGKNYLHIHSTDKSSRYDTNYNVKTGIDASCEYLCTFKAKTENVVVNRKNAGLYLRLAQVKSDGKTGIGTESKRITGTTDGWVEYGFVTKGFPGKDITGFQLDVFAEYFSGDVYLDDIRIVPAHDFSLNESEKTLYTGDSLQLEAVVPDGYEEELADLQWSSSDPEIASVDETGLVTANAIGVAKITAQIGDYYQASCEISVEDASLKPYYKTIRDAWRERLTGNDIEDASDAVYQKTMSELTEEAQTLWDRMIKGGNERTKIWTDIDFVYRYQKTTSNVTEALGTGMQRIEKLATAYTAEGSALYHNEELKKDIIAALEWVYATMYSDKMSAQNDTYGNWYHWFIGMPQSLCNTVILMYDELSEDLIEREAKTLETFNWDPNERYVVCGGNKVANTAGNLIDTSLVSALRAAIGETAKPLGMARTALEGSLGYVDSGNGYYADGSYIDHTNLAYTGGYGSTLLGGMEKLLFIVDDTPWAIDDEKLTSVFAWIENSIRPLFADGAAMDMTTGRGVARPSTNDQTVGRGLLKPIAHLVELAPDELREELRSFAKTQIAAGLKYNEDYFTGMTVADVTAMQNLLADDAIDEDTEVYHKNFGAMDKATYHGENFALGISMYSKRTGSFEYGNKENSKGWHQSDGALYLYNGDQAQYADKYWPTVDAHRLAGITTDHTKGYIPSGNTWNNHVSSKEWVGGSSVLGKYGSVGMDFEGELENGKISSLKAKKSWFTFPDGVVALGAGINSSENKETETIVDNRKVLDDAVNAVWADGKELNLELGKDAAVKTQWALLEGNNGAHENIGYYFPEETEVHVLKENRTGNWRDINGAIAAGSANDCKIQRSYISLALDHGVNPTNESYSYVLLPGRTTDEMEAYAENPGIRILANTEKVQAVEHTGYGVSGYNFWEGTELEGLPVAAETAASVTLAKEDGTMTLGISNPTQNGKDTVVVLRGNYEKVSADEGVKVVSKEGKTRITIDGAKDFGKTYTVELVGIETKLQGWKDEIAQVKLGDAQTIKDILETLDALRLEDYSEEQQTEIEVVKEAAEKRLAELTKTSALVAELAEISAVTYENADEAALKLEAYEALSDEEKALLGEAEQTIIRQLYDGFQTKDIHVEEENVLWVEAANETGKEDVRTKFAWSDETMEEEYYQNLLPENETILALFRPTLTLKNAALSFVQHPVKVSMELPTYEGEGTVQLRYFAVEADASAGNSAACEIDGTQARFSLNRDGVYAFVLQNTQTPDVKPEPEPDPTPTPDEKPDPEPEPTPTPDEKPIRKGISSIGAVNTNKQQKEAQGTWVQNASGWWYRYRNGSWSASAWALIDGKWYHFNADGYMQTGWLLENGIWYYLKADGAMASNEWIQTNGRWYYLSENGGMLSNTTVNWKGSSYQLGADGAMQD